MAKLIFGLMQSLDGYVSGPEGGPGLPMPDEALTRHFSEQLRKTTGSLYGRRMYEIMRYWDGEEADQEEAGREFARPGGQSRNGSSRAPSNRSGRTRR